MSSIPPLRPQFRCDGCGATFQAGGIGAVGGSISFSNIGVRCPECGEWARIIAGKHSWDEELRQYLFKATDEQKEKLRAVVQSLPQDATAETLASSVDSFWPEFAAKLRAWALDNPGSVVTAVISLLGVLVTAGTGAVVAGTGIATLLETKAHNRRMDEHAWREERNSQERLDLDRRNSTAKNRVDLLNAQTKAEEVRLGRAKFEEERRAREAKEEKQRAERKRRKKLTDKNKRRNR